MAKNTVDTINKRIARIRDVYDIQPITLKSEFDIFKVIIYPKNSSREGEIMDYQEANRNFMIHNNGNTLSRDFYDKVLNELINPNKPYFEKTYVNSQISRSAEMADAVAEGLRGRGYLTKEELRDFKNMSRLDRINFMKELGKLIDTYGGKEGYSSEQIIFDAFDDMTKLLSGEVRSNIEGTNNGNI